MCNHSNYYFHIWSNECVTIHMLRKVFKHVQLVLVKLVQCQLSLKGYWHGQKSQEVEEKGYYSIATLSSLE